MSYLDDSPCFSPTTGQFPYGGQRQCTGRRTLTFYPFLAYPLSRIGFWIGFTFSKCFCFGFDLVDLFDFYLG